MIKNRLFLATTFLIALLSGCSSDTTSSGASAQNAMVSKDIYNLVGTEGESFKVTKKANNFFVDGTQGKVVIFDLFATWCPPCKAEAPHLGNLQRKYKDELLILGITIEENKGNESLNAWKKEYNATYAFVNSSANQKLSRAIASTIGVGERFGIPLMVMFKDGKYITHYAGAVPEEMIESDIKVALGK
ncbi:MAG: redoxin family protein [Helicobacteraceae bacterium]|nr:redoxin family protein [Helicobacteraceae bacterium]